MVDSSSLLPYGITSSAPAIVLPDVDLFKSERGAQAANFFEGKFQDLQKQYEDLVKLANETDVVYKSTYGFEPKVGKTYHLYRKDGGHFLSMISPSEWDKYEFVGSYRFTADAVWENA